MNINASYIHLENILFFAHHGVATQETIVGNEFYINLDFPAIEEVEIKLSKRNPPMGADIDAAGVEMFCTRT